MKIFVGLVVLVLGLISVPSAANALWAGLSDTEVIEQSDLIITAELIGQTQIMINGAKLVLGVLKIEEVLKGNENQNVVLLALPPFDRPRIGTDIFYKKGQKGLWFLRERKTNGEAGIYLADHPQRFLSEDAAKQIEAFRKILINKASKF